jgi:hypothetical protein
MNRSEGPSTTRTGNFGGRCGVWLTACSGILYQTLILPTNARREEGLSWLRSAGLLAEFLRLAKVMTWFGFRGEMQYRCYWQSLD